MAATLAAAMAAVMLTAATPASTLKAENTSDTTTTQATANGAGAKVYVRGMTVNGRPATQQEKEVAKAMVKQGGRMAGKGVQLAATAITDPSRADKLSEELEAMGDEMERMGDSLEMLADDTTFLYEGEEGDSIVIAEDDADDFINEISKSFGIDLSDTWWGGILGGGLGILGGTLGIIIGLLALLVVLALLTSPLWIVAVIIYLIVRNDRNVAAKRRATYAAAQQPTTETPQTATATPQPATATPQTATSIEGIAEEKRATWTNGVRQCCLGVGLIVFFIAIGLESFWGIGALVACLGVANLIIAYSAKPKEHYEKMPQADNNADGTASGNYDK